MMIANTEAAIDLPVEFLTLVGFTLAGIAILTHLTGLTRGRTGYSVNGFRFAIASLVAVFLAAFLDAVFLAYDLVWEVFQAATICYLLALVLAGVTSVLLLVSSFHHESSPPSTSS